MKYKVIIIFYLVVATLIFIFRKKFDIQNKIIFLLRTKIGLNLMDRIATKHREWVILLGYIGAGVGFVGMVFISGVLIKNLYDLITVENAASGVSLVLPGANVPGVGILPFWHWLFAIFLIAVVHEFSHGVVARAHKIEVKSSGLVLFGPIIGAFVEPDEKKMSKADDIVQYSVLAAGAFSNILLSLIALGLLFAVSPLEQSMRTPVGFTFDAYVSPDLPIAVAGIEPGSVITGADGAVVTTFADLQKTLDTKKPGDTIVLKTDGVEKAIVLAANPADATKPFLGITNIHDTFDVKPEYAGGLSYVYAVVHEMGEFFKWVFLLSMGIGVFNLLPLPIVDGGRMVQTFCRKLKGTVLGDKRYGQIGMFFLLLLLLNLLYPLIAKIPGLLMKIFAA